MTTTDEEVAEAEVEPATPPAIRDEARAAATMADIEPLRSIREIHAILTAPALDDELNVKPSGELYMSHVHCRRRLTEAFGLVWCLDRIGEWSKERNVSTKYDGKEVVSISVAAEFALRIPIGGQMVTKSTAWGEGEYFENNANAGKTDAFEAAKSQALTRCCKDLGIGAECWDRVFAEKWKRKHCVEVKVAKTNRPQWRRRDAPPAWNEEGVIGEQPRQRPRSTDDAPPQRQAPAREAAPSPNAQWPKSVAGEGGDEKAGIFARLESVAMRPAKEGGGVLVVMGIGGERYLSKSEAVGKWAEAHKGRMVRVGYYIHLGPDGAEYRKVSSLRLDEEGAGE